MLRDDFPLYSAGARRLLAFEESDNAGDARAGDAFGAPGGRALLIAECARTAAEILAAAPGRIAKGSLTRDDADRQAAIFRAIAADIAAELGHFQDLWRRLAIPGPLDWRALPLLPVPRAGDPYGWEEKIHALRREIHLRRQYDPDKIAKGRLAPGDARERLERLEAVHAKYYGEMFGWSSPTGAEPGSPPWRAEVKAHADELARASLCSPARAEGQEEAAGQEALV